MSARKPRRQPPPLTADLLNEMALRYAGRFATTRAKLRSYLARKVRERGWSGSAESDLEELAERFAERGYVDDQGYAVAKARSLTGRGYGKARLVQSLRIAGIEEADCEAAHGYADAEAVNAALRFAQRKRIGPYAADLPDPKGRERALAAMLRAGHSFALSRAIIGIGPGGEIDAERLKDLTTYSAS